MIVAALTDLYIRTMFRLLWEAFKDIILSDTLPVGQFALPESGTQQSSCNFVALIALFVF